MTRAVADEEVQYPVAVAVTESRNRICANVDRLSAREDRFRSLEYGVTLRTFIG